MTAKTLKHKKLIITLAIILIFIITFITAFFIILKIGEYKLKNSLIADEKINLSDDFDYSADVYHNGKAYNYNDNLINILLIGVDKYTFLRDSQGQADALYLISLDTEKNNVNIFSISRNSITDVDIFDADGKYYASEKKQICLSYSYGKTDEQSSENCVKSVSRMFYGIPINSYYTLYLDAIADIVDSVGGVNVTFNEDLLSDFPNNKKGDKLLLKGADALKYLRARGESNAPRLERQKAFISEFVNSAKKAALKDFSLPVDMFNKLKKESVTNIDATSVAYLASKAVSSDFSILSVDGKSGFDGTYETFEVDEDKLYEQVLKAFYKEKK